MQMTYEESINIGLELRKQMKSPAMQTVIEVLRQDYHQRMFQSQPQEHVLREDTYRRSQVLDDLVATINSFELLAEQAIEEPQEN